MEPNKADWFSGLSKALAGCCEAQSLKQVFPDAGKPTQQWEPARNPQYIAFSAPSMHSKATHAQQSAAHSRLLPGHSEPPPSDPLGILKAPAGPAVRKARSITISVPADRPASPPARKVKSPQSPEKAPGGVEDDDEDSPKRPAGSPSRHWRSQTSFMSKGKTKSIRRNGMIIQRSSTISSPQRESVLDAYNQLGAKGKTRSLR